LAETYELILRQRHPELKKKDENWKLIYNSYLGGTNFSEAGYLIKYPKESPASFETRKKRAVYFNQVSPIVDMMSGLLYLNEPIRKIPQKYHYLVDNMSGDKKISEFMRNVSAHSFMFTCGVLVDMPDFNPEVIKTKKDANDNKINPYATLYLPFRIRDFNINSDDGGLDWVILDNSFYDHSDPMSLGVTVTRYTLWDRMGYENFEQREGSESIVSGGRKEHGIGYVPFRFVSWRDDNSDFISESVCEDIAMVSKLIYNNMSYMDEMLAAGTFKMLAYPTKTGEVPKSMTMGGVGPLSIIPYDITASTAPSFIGHSLQDVEPFIKAITFYMAEVLKKVGLSTDETKEFVKSGAAKKIDFQKMKALLISGALMMGKLEEWIFRTAGAWNQDFSVDIKVDYTSSFSDEDLVTEVTLLTELLVLPIKTLNKEVTKLLVKKTMGNYLEPQVIEEINKEIDSSNSVGTIEQESKSSIDVNAAADVIKKNTDLTGQGATDA